MPEINTIGIVELTSISLGYQVQDAMLKTAAVSLILARSVCPGKYLIAITGDVSSVKASVATGVAMGAGAVVEQGVIANIHPSIFPALAQSVEVPPEGTGAMGVVETFSAASLIVAADAAAKTAEVTMLRVYLAMAIGGKAYCLMTGKLGDVEAAVEAAAQSAGESGMLVSKVVIPAPHRDLFKEYI